MATSKSTSSSIFSALWTTSGARARFRESIYISFIFCVALAWLICYGPQVLFHQPRLINPADVLSSATRN